MSKKILCKVCVKKRKETDITESFTLSGDEVLLFDQYLRAKHVEEPPIGYYVSVDISFDSRICITKFEASTSVLFHECELKFPVQLTGDPDIFDEYTEPHELVTKVISLLCNQCDIENMSNCEKDDNLMQPPQKTYSRKFSTDETSERPSRPDNNFETSNLIQRDQSQLFGQTEHQLVETSTDMSYSPQPHDERIVVSTNITQTISTEKLPAHCDSCDNSGQQDIYGLATPQTELIYQSYGTMGTCDGTYYGTRSDAYNCACYGTCNNDIMYRKYNTLTSYTDQVEKLRMLLNEDILVVFNAERWSRCRCRLVEDSRVFGYAVQVDVCQAEPMRWFFGITPLFAVQVILKYVDVSYLGQGYFCTFQGGYCLFLC